MDIFIFLLSEGADPNVACPNGFTCLHYVSLSKAPLAFVQVLLSRKPKLDVWSLVGGLLCTPLQTAAINDRDDVVRELISAGAHVRPMLTKDAKSKECNKKLCEIINQMASAGNEVCSKIRLFFDMHLAVMEKTPEEVFRIFHSHMLEHDPQIQLTMIETLFTVSGPGAEKYPQECFKWLKDTGNLHSYIAGAVSRLPKISNECVYQEIFSLHAVFCTLEEIPNDQALEIIPQLVERLGTKERPDICELVMQTLYVISQKTKSTTEWNPTFVESLCKAVAPFVQEAYPISIRRFTYGIFANLLSVKHTVKFLKSEGICSVPQDILASADMNMNDKLKEMLRRLNGHLSNPTLESAALAESGKKKKKRKKRKKKQNSEQPENANNEGGATAADPVTIPVVESGLHVKPFQANSTTVKPQKHRNG
ncbi:uncharacterized protein LOC114868756 isoform X1 [Betta splendens]|uniref:Uncharacterized protein LOC114868756 isoform X1 n=1 Tax=Betta splendens TaxID=158456 RepID=A0A8M1HLB8_BETSP|nr:uncharacterized protein LOC114868756 isoform X1 [Betta splendens]XP_040929281.1 uncharacterized protein LOC114868756 isoform X1 [Betta splendens]